jgi:anionic cell wall polymer biosynthesis LytR-Cps2A-Psr (LCP) family protein
LAKMNEITGIPLTYYAFVDFAGFETFIDTLE